MKLQPTHLTDERIIAIMKRIGIEPGKSFDIDRENSKTVATNSELASHALAQEESHHYGRPTIVSRASC
jgi:hypothetical protein